MFRRVAVCVCAVVALAPLTRSVAPAQSAGTKAIPSIQFKAGTHTTVLDSTVAPAVTVGPDMTNDGSQRYSLGAKAGQVLTLAISSDNHHAVFSLVKPSPAMVKSEIVERAGGVTRWSGRLLEPGNYLVTVFTRDRDAASRFTLRVTLH